MLFFGLSYETIWNLICYAKGQYSAEIITEFALIDTIGLVAIPVLFVFGAAAAYIDAVFLDTYQNLLFITLILSMSIWQCAVLMFKPIGRLFNVVESNVNETHHMSCDLNDTFFHGFHYIDHICSPVYTETSMIMLGIALKLWHSFISDTWPENNPERSRVCTWNLSIPLSRKITLYVKKNFRRFAKSSCRSTNPEIVPLLLTNSSRQCSKGLFAAWVYIVMTNLPYLGVCLYFAFKPTQHGQTNPDDSFYEKSVLWSFEIVFSLSFCIIYSCQKIRDKLIACHSGMETGGSLWKLKGHEIMLLVCSNGVFCQCVFLCTAATGSLISNHQLDTDQRVSCAVAIILSLIKVLMVWQMTIFLLRIPRQQLNQPFQRKLVLVCLINVMVISGNQWLVTNLNEHETFPLEQLYFGDVAGKAIGVLLEPFGTIY